jgi:putative DNA methylase
MTDRKKLIEVALPLEAINEASAREKSIRHGHPSTLHLWWARRPLAACRAVIFTSLVDDPDNPNAPEAFVAACKKLPKGKNAAESDTPRQRLFDFIERLVTWEATTDDALLEQARELIRLSTDGYPPPLLDPFAGGGSIPLEAQRLGLEAHASDLNPVAVMINKAMIEIPPLFKDQPPVNPRDRAKMGANTRWKGAAGLAADVRYYGEWMREQAWERIGHLYPQCNGETVIAWLWARTVKCPNPACGATMPLVTSFWLSKKKGHKAWVEPIIVEDEKEVQFKVHMGEGKPPKAPKIGRGAKFRCLVCGEVSPDDHIKREGIEGRMGSKLMAVVTEGTSGRNYHSPSCFDLTVLQNIAPDWYPVGLLADDPRAIWCKGYGLSKIGDLFTDRQLKVISTLNNLLLEVKQVIQNDATNTSINNGKSSLVDKSIGAESYSQAIVVYLAFAIDRNTNYWSNISSWASSRQTIRSVFSRQGIPMAWDYAEANPFSNSTGNWLGAINWIEKSLEALRPVRQGYANQKDAAMLSFSDGVPISTDPPYYDNIGYAILSDFFYAFLRENLETIYPDLFSTILVPKSPELVATPYRFDGDTKKADAFFEKGLRQAFCQIRKIIPKDIPFSVYYAFKQEEIASGSEVANTGWEIMLKGLIDSDFCITGTWPIRTELSNRMVGSGVNALASSIVLVCRPRLGFNSKITRKDLVRNLRERIPTAINEMQTGNIAPVDLAQAAIGPGMAVYSRYSKVLEPDGSELTVRTALQLINQVLDEYLAEQEGAMDQASRFAVTWFSQYGFDAGPYGQAEVLSKAKDTSVEGMARHGVLEAEAGKVRLLRWDELDPGQSLQSGMVWAATHLLIERLNTHGETGAAKLLASLPPDLAADARALAYRLYSIADRKGWSSLARHYNALVVSWSEAQEEARSIRKDTPRQGTLFEDES